LGLPNQGHPHRRAAGPPGRVFAVRPDRHPDLEHASRRYKVGLTSLNSSGKRTVNVALYPSFAPFGIAQSGDIPWI
jgi:hypothetical protein